MKTALTKTRELTIFLIFCIYVFFLGELNLNFLIFSGQTEATACHDTFKHVVY